MILGRFMGIASPILNPRLLFVIWVIWDTSDLFAEQKTSFMCFVTETRILFVCLEDISGSFISNLRGQRSVVRIDYLYAIRGLPPFGAFIVRNTPELSSLTLSDLSRHVREIRAILRSHCRFWHLCTFFRKTDVLITVNWHQSKSNQLFFRDSGSYEPATPGALIRWDMLQSIL
jgi:hypothetical protein